jgi:hypothetical protein
LLAHPHHAEGSAWARRVLAFPKATVEQVIPFIAESTGKVIIPQQEILARRLTVVNDKPIPRKAALDMLFFALQQAGVAVIENPDFILLRDQADIDRQPVPVVVGVPGVAQAVAIEVGPVPGPVEPPRGAVVAVVTVPVAVRPQNGPTRA